jgi:PKD repeat protein
MDRDAFQLEQPAHSVKLIKIIDSSVPAAAPTVSLHVPERAKVGEEVQFSSAATPDSAPALTYRWDFGDGTTEDGRRVSHAYTTAGQFSVRLIVEGIDGISAEKNAHVSVDGTAIIAPPQRYKPN